MSLPVSADHQPAVISPEGAIVANTYLENGMDMGKTAELLEMPKHEVNRILSTVSIKDYVYSIVSDANIRNMDSIQQKMDDIIKKKLEEMDDLEMTSAKDVADLLQIAHKMAESKAKVLEKKAPIAPKNVPGTVTNNTLTVLAADDNSQYGRLMQAIIKGT